MGTTQVELADFGDRTSADEVVRGLDLSGQVMIVTGANTGIGYETARSLASAGAKVILACRNADKGEAAAERIRAAHASADVRFAPLDLASFESVRAFARDFEAASIDVLICNAGVINASYRESDGGIEHTLGVSHVGHFLLVRELLPRLLAGGAGRVVVVSSGAHRNPKTLDFERLPMPKEDFGLATYGQAKLCNVLFANELQRRYGDRGLSACSLHPGSMVTTDIGRNSLLMRVVVKLLSPFTKNPSQGASTSVLCAVHPDPQAIGGRYFSDCKEAEMSDEARDSEVAARLWQRSEEWLS